MEDAIPVSSWATSAAGNDNTLGVFIGEGCDAGNLNNADREIMAQVRVKFDSTDAAITALGTPQPASGVLTGLSSAGAIVDTIPVYTGPDTATLFSLTPFARTVIDDVDATAARATLGALGIPTAVADDPGYVALNLLGDGLFLMQFGSGSIGPSTTQVVTYATPFSTAGYPVLTGAAALTITAVGTSSFTITNATGGTVAYRWQAMGF